MRADERVLGSGEFVERMLAAGDARQLGVSTSGIAKAVARVERLAVH